MTPRIEVTLWFSALVMSGIGMAIMLHRPPRTELPYRVPTAKALMAPVANEPAVRTVVAVNPFRLDRSPAPLRFRPGASIAAPGLVPSPSMVTRPVLLLRAIAGPPWEAVVEGIPGRNEPVVLREGDRMGDLLIRAIGRDTVVVSGMDTTWYLTLSQSWR